MDTNNYIGSFAQENVSFQTMVEESSSFGENMMSTMVFTDKALISDASILEAVDGSTTVKAGVVTADDFGSATTGILQSWLADLFASGSIYKAYLVTVDGTDVVLDATTLAEAYDLLKPYAYFKTVCPADATDATALDNTRFATLASALAPLCAADKQVLSSPVIAPYSGNGTDLSTNAVYTALKDKFVFMSHCPDATRNAALFAVGKALSTIAAGTSGTPVGNQFEMWKTNSMVKSGLSKTVRTTLNDANIQTWKPIGDNSSYVAAEGGYTLNGEYMQGLWIVARVTYMAKVDIAKYMTSPNVFKNATSYAAILSLLSDRLREHKGVLADITITAPGYGDLPSSDADTLIIPNAWTARLPLTLKHVTISGTLYIGD